MQAHIHKLLFEHDCVIIPDFGGLITHYEAARIHPVKHTFLPPSKRVAFNEKLKINDGLLINTFAYDRHISAEEAHVQVAAFVRQLQTELSTNQRFVLKGVGVFRLNIEQKIEFEYIPADNFLEDSFGLPEFISRPVIAADATAGLRTLLKEKESEGAATTAKPSLRRKMRRLYDMAAVFAITGLTVGALYIISQQTNYSLSTLNPFAIVYPESNPTAQRSTIKIKNNNEINKKEILSIDTTVPKNTNTEVAINNQPVTEPTIEKPAAPIAELTNKAPEVAVAKLVTEIKKSEVDKDAKVISAPVSTIRKAVAKKVYKAAAKSYIKTNTSLLTIKEQTGRYYIIGGGYSSLEFADQNRKLMLRHSSKEGKIILPYTGSKLHRVAISDYASKEEALQELPALRKKFGPNIWILNY